MLDARERMAAGVEGEARSPGRREGPGDLVEIGPPRDRFVGDRVEARESRLHVKRWPAATPRPRIQSAAGMRAFPAGWTSATATAPPLAAITSSRPAASTSPGAPGVSTV